jgi:hypothetical protein
MFFLRNRYLPDFLDGDPQGKSEGPVFGRRTKLWKKAGRKIRRLR